MQYISAEIRSNEKRKAYKARSLLHLFVCRQQSFSTYWYLPGLAYASKHRNRHCSDRKCSSSFTVTEEEESEEGEIFGSNQSV